MSNLFACLDSDNDEPVAKPVAKPVAGKDAKATAAGAKTAASGNDKNAGKSPAAAKPTSAAGPKKGTSVFLCVLLQLVTFFLFVFIPLFLTTLWYIRFSIPYTH